LVRLFNEVAYVWPKVGYPPLVTPFSQYVKNIALMNLLAESMDKPRYSMMDQSIWGMILGKSGKLPGEVASEIVELAKQKGLEFTDANPQDNYPDDLPTFIKEMEDNGWDRGQDDEELFELAMHPTQYRDYKSGIAKERFEADLAKAKAAAAAPAAAPKAEAPKAAAPAKGADANEEVAAAISMAVAQATAGDQESGIITIKPYDSPWAVHRF
jgi:pyruvate carboxylase subunit B